MSSIHIRHPVSIHTHTRVSWLLMTPIWEVFHKMWKQRQHGEHWTHFSLVSRREVAPFWEPYDSTTTRRLLGAFPGEEPNETFQDVVPIIFTLDFLQKVGNNILKRSLLLINCEIFLFKKFYKRRTRKTNFRNTKISAFVCSLWDEGQMLNVFVCSIQKPDFSM